MATMILSTVGSAIGTVLGGPIGGVLGRVAGSAAGSLINGAGSGTKTRFVQGPRLSDVSGMTSTEGDPIPRVYGRARIGSGLIWATRPLELANTAVEKAASPSKGGGGGQRTVRTTYAYYANLAVGLCEGPIAFVRRIWADGVELDQSRVTLRVHLGTPDQAPDPLIVAKEGADNAPAYRGLAYVVFESLPLADYGNRIPQFTFEVVRPVNGLCGLIRAVNLIPGAGEFVLDPTSVTVDLGLGRTQSANRHQLVRSSDVRASLDALQALCPNLRRVAVVVAWFGDDLRAAHCRIAPRVETPVKTSRGDTWSVAGLTRAEAQTVSTLPDGVTPAYGGTPSDAGLGRLVADLSARGLDVVLYPFIMMDVAPGNALPDPHAPGGTQPPYPWRGRITCDPAPGLPGSPDGTDAAALQVSAFIEAYRPMLRHYAGLAASWAQSGARIAGFLIGSEFIGLTRVRGATDYPAVTGLRALAAEMRRILGAGVPLVYAADWTEYGAHVRDGGATIRFPLDALFADPNIAAVGIDWYPPLTDWRDTPAHADLALAGEIYDRDYLRSRAAAGEAFEWFYPDAAARAAQARVPITDGAFGKPWIYRAKDIAAWWSNPHVERDGGVETRATAWVPRSKPIWLTELGVPAVDKGTNAPNVFPDPKSSENALPPDSLGTRDDLIQLRGLEALLGRFDPAAPGFSDADNPVSPVYGGRMVDPASAFVWCWDARPFPVFSDMTSTWADAGQWGHGHWITGRLEGCDLDRLITLILADFGFDAPVSVQAAAFLDGYAVDRPLSARSALETLAQVYGLDVSAGGGVLRLRGPRNAAALEILRGDLVRVSDETPVLRRVRAEESSLPRTIEIAVTDAENSDYRRASAAATRPVGGRRGQTKVETAIVTRREVADGLAEDMLDRLLAARETASFTLSPRLQDVEPGDLLAVPMDDTGVAVPMRVERIDDAPTGRRIDASRVPSRTGPPRPVRRSRAASAPAVTPAAGAPLPIALDLPVDWGTPTGLQYLAVAAEPWPGPVTVWRAEAEGEFAVHGTVDYPACVGRILSPLPPGPLWRRDRGTRLDVMLRRAGALASVSPSAMLAGGNLFAVLAPDGTVEILAVTDAVATGSDTFALSGLLRGLAGSEAAAGRGAPVGSLIVRLDDGAVTPLIDRLDEAGRLFRYRVGAASLDPSDPAMGAMEATAGVSALRPLRPVHLRARRIGADIGLSWIRRARRSADAWEPVDVPRDEAAESYVVTLFSGGRPIRSLTASGPTLTYPAASESADYGRPQTVLDISVAQAGAVAGLGPATRALVPIRAA